MSQTFKLKMPAMLVAALMLCAAGPVLAKEAAPENAVRIPQPKPHDHDRHVGKSYELWAKLQQAVPGLQNDAVPHARGDYPGNYYATPSPRPKAKVRQRLYQPSL